MRYQAALRPDRLKSAAKDDRFLIFAIKDDRKSTGIL
jgi:hypothetical protein